MRNTDNDSRTLPLLAILAYFGVLILASLSVQAARLDMVGDSITHDLQGGGKSGVFMPGG